MKSERKANLLGLDIQDVLVVLLLFGVFSSIAAWHRYRPRQSEWLARDMIQHLGAENNTIANAILHGRGFSDPFRVETGPTAWMPPLLPYLTAGLYTICGNDRDRVVVCVVCLQCFVVILTGLIVTRLATNHDCRLIGYVAVGVGFSMEFHELFQKTHDTWLVLLVYDLLLVGLCALEKPPRQWHRLLGWGVFGGAAALASPTAGFTWAGATTIRWLSTTDQSTTARKSAIKAVAAVAIVSMLVVTPWTIRNRVVFGRWIPIKSNAAYEVWQSQCLDQDGVLDSYSATQHPWLADGEQRRDYQRQGELEFLDQKWELAWTSIKSAPMDAAERVANRLLVATFFYQPFNTLEKEHFTTTYLRLVFPLPALALLVAWLLANPERSGTLATATSLYTLGLLPYVLVSYYGRYGAPLIVVKMLLFVLAYDALRRLAIARWKQPQAAA